VGGTVLLCLVAGFALTRTVAVWLEREFDRGLEAKARSLVALTEQEAGDIEFEFQSEHMPEFAEGAAPEYFELWLADGTLIARSPSFEVSPAARAAALVKSAGLAATPVFQDLRLPDGRRGRQVRIDFLPRPDDEDDPAPATPAPGAARAPSPPQTVTVIVARERERFEADVRRLNAGVGILGVGLLLALAGLTHVVLRKGLRSLDDLNRQVRALGVTSLGTRVGVQAPPEEIALVVAQINGLLDRLEAGFTRERRLSSDIAHELKTPIAELRSLCEVGARWPDDRAAVQEFFRDARAIALQMERIVVHLVALARYDEGQERICTAQVRVADVVDAAWKPLARAAAAKGLEYRQQIPPTMCFETDPDKFPLMVANILSNAVAYSPHGSCVVCASDETSGHLSVSFSNRAEHLQAQDLTVMFDRFWRKDEARAGGRHVGLGLSLVRAMADLLAIEVVTRLEADKTFSITLGQKRNCTSEPTIQAPSARGNAEPGKK
jgi:two-component system, OmpR family, heavy metal sensor histidine kinase CusS